MCKKCIIEPYVNRHSSCIEKGAYLINYKGSLRNIL